MSRFTNSAAPRPHYESNRYRPSPSRREAIHGRIQGIPDRRDPTAKLFVALALLVALIFAAQLLRVVVRGVL